MQQLSIAIIGGGPSGLVTLKTLLEVADRYDDVDLKVSLFEAEEEIGGTFRYRSYGKHLHVLSLLGDVSDSIFLLYQTTLDLSLPSS